MFTFLSSVHHGTTLQITRTGGKLPAPTHVGTGKQEVAAGTRSCPPSESRPHLCEKREPCPKWVSTAPAPPSTRERELVIVTPCSLVPRRCYVAALASPHQPLRPINLPRSRSPQIKCTAQPLTANTKIRGECTKQHCSARLREGIRAESSPRVQPHPVGPARNAERRLCGD